MKNDPLQHPGGQTDLSRSFLHFFGLQQGPPTAAFLAQVARAFSALPYENLTKIIKLDDQGMPRHARRPPDEVFADHTQLRTGGTCFSLTALLLHLVRACGFMAEPVLADRRYGPDTHCALLVTLDGKPHLLDPGFLIFNPIELESQTEKHILTPFNEVILRPQERGKLALSTKQHNSEAYRLTFKLPGADPGEFMRAWHASFDWDMMRYPVLTRLLGRQQKYLQKTDYKERDRKHVTKKKIGRDDMVGDIAREFGIAADVAARALTILERKEGSLDDA